MVIVMFSGLMLSLLLSSSHVFVISIFVFSVFVIVKLFPLFVTVFVYPSIVSSVILYCIIWLPIITGKSLNVWFHPYSSLNVILSYSIPFASNIIVTSSCTVKSSIHTFVTLTSVFSVFVIDTLYPFVILAVVMLYVTMYPSGVSSII